jgi:16S rRNA processing protein RimM
MSEKVEVVVGLIGRPHGLHGEVAIDSRTDEPERRFAPGQVVRSEDGRRSLTVASSREHSGRLLVTFSGLFDRTAVEELRGTRLVVDVESAELPAEEGEFYDRQLVGLRVLDATGTEVGRVEAVRHFPAQDLLEVKTAQGARLVPFVLDLVPEVDLGQGIVRLADLPGLLVDEDEG